MWLAPDFLSLNKYSEFAPEYCCIAPEQFGEIVNIQWYQY